MKTIFVGQSQFPYDSSMICMSSKPTVNVSNIVIDLLEEKELHVYSVRILL